VAATIINLILNIILIPLWNITGAAVATLLSQFIYWFGCYIFAQKAYYIPYEIKKLSILFVIGTLFALSSLVLNNFDVALRLPLKLLFAFLFPVVLYFFKFYEPVELDAIRGFTRKWSDLSMLKRNIMSLKDIKDED
jgi:O-antigen/teichoic acid export membrane protein